VPPPATPFEAFVRRIAAVPKAKVDALDAEEREAQKRERDSKKAS